MSSVRATAAPMSSDPAAREQGRTLAGLIDVLDRADGPAMTRRPQPRRTSAHRPSGARPVRTVPLRSVQPAPMARPVPAAAPRAYVVPEPERVAVTGLADLLRRAGMWGA